MITKCKLDLLGRKPWRDKNILHSPAVLVLDSQKLCSGLKSLGLDHFFLKDQVFPSKADQPCAASSLPLFASPLSFSTTTNSLKHSIKGFLVLFFLVLLDLDFEIQPFSLCPSLDDILQLAAFRFSTCFGQVGFQHFHFPFQQLLCSVLSSLRTSCVWFLTNFCLSGKKALVAPFSRPRALVHCLVFCCLAIFPFCLPGTTIDDNAWRYTRRRPPIGGRGGGRGLRRVAEGALACRRVR